MCMFSLLIGEFMNTDNTNKFRYSSDWVRPKDDQSVSKRVEIKISVSKKDSKVLTTTVRVVAQNEFQKWVSGVLHSMGWDKNKEWTSLVSDKSFCKVKIHTEKDLKPAETSTDKNIATPPSGDQTTRVDLTRNKTNDFF